MWFGKLIGGLIGLLTAGIFGLILGVVAGHYFDKALRGQTGKISAEERAQIEETFFRTVFLLMGHLAKADGRVSETEIAHTESLMSKMALYSDHRRRAIEIFKEGTEGKFDLQQEMATYKQVCGRHPALSQQLLNYLLSLSLADGQLSANEEDVLRQIASGLGISAMMFEQLLRMVKAQTHFRHDSQGHYSAGNQTPGKDELAFAYDALGVSPDATDTEIKRAYRKLMSENHPDKLTGQGMPEDMIKLATERSQEIQTAYELIKKSRN